MRRPLFGKATRDEPPTLRFEGKLTRALLGVWREEGARAVKLLRKDRTLPIDFWTEIEAKQRKVVRAWLLEVTKAGVEAGFEALYPSIKNADGRTGTDWEERGLGMRKQAGAGISWDLVNADAADWAREHSSELVKGITDTTRRLTRDAIGDWVEAGEAFPALAKRVGAIFDDCRRAELIAATEATRAYAEANTQVWRAANVAQREWRTVVDRDVCDLCKSLHQVRAKTGEPFVSESGVTVDNPPAHPGCRCSMVPVVKPEEAPAAAMGGRLLPLAERQAMTELAEAERAYQEMMAAGDTYGAEGIKSYMDALEGSLGQERRINEALWEQFGLTPGRATAADWELLANSLEREGYDLYKKYTKEGIQITVVERRGAQADGWMSVGKEVVEVRAGRFSRRAARQMEGDLWRDAKERLQVEMDGYLRQVGYGKAAIREASYEQQLKLFQELGGKQLTQTARGMPIKIDNVSVEARSRMIRLIDYDAAAICGNVANSPLSLPSLDAYGKMELAEVIRATR